MANQTYEAEVDTSPEMKKGSGGGCLKGCLIITVILILIIVGLTIGGYYYLKSQINKYTSDKPADIPSVTLPAEQLEELQARVDSFQSSFEEIAKPDEDGSENVELILTQDEINALIASNPDFANRVFVTIKDGNVSADVSIPLDEVPMAGGRYLNASASLNVSMNNGALLVTLADASVNGQPIPQEIVTAMQSENLAAELYKEPEAVKVIQRVKELKIEDKRIILVATPKVSADKPAEVANEDSSSDK